MLDQIEINTEETSHLDFPGVRIAISAVNGIFASMNYINSENFWILTNEETVKKTFPKRTLPQDVMMDYIIFQGSLSVVDYFVNNGLYFCSDDPLNADFNVI